MKAYSPSFVYTLGTTSRSKSPGKFILCQHIRNVFRTKATKWFKQDSEINFVVNLTICAEF